MEKLGHYQEIASALIERDKDRDGMLAKSEQMYRNEWDLPAGLKELDYIHKVVSTDPHDALRAGTRVLSSVWPKLKIHPLGPNDKERANKMERALMWHFKNAARRPRANIVQDMVLSSLMADEVSAQVVYLPWQAKLTGMSKEKLSRALRYGPFAITVRNPRDVHAVYSEWGLEKVLYSSIQRADEFVGFWGGDFYKKLKPDENTEYVTVYDYTDEDVRCIWACAGSNYEASSPDKGVELVREKHGLPFIPWVCRVGGSNITGNTPMLWSVIKSGQWDTQNIIETLVLSDALTTFAGPRHIFKMVGDQVPEVEYGVPGGALVMGPQEEYQQLPPRMLDQSMTSLAERVGYRMAKSTVPNVIQTSDFPSGTAFATANLATQSGIKSINPYKVLAQYAIADIFIQMLYWVDFTGDPLTAYDTDGNGLQATIGGEAGMKFDVNAIYMDVELTADVATDRMARANTAALLVQQGIIDKSEAGDQVGVADPERMRQSRFAEILEEADIQLAIEEKKAALQMKIQQQMMELQEMQQRKQMINQQRMQQQASQQQPNMASQQPRPGSPRGMPGINGQGVNPAAGGTPPAMANPEATREGQTRRSRTGEDISG